MPRKYFLTRSDYEALARKSRRAQKRDQSEICGALLINASGRIHLRYLKNQSAKPGRWDILIEDLRRSREEARRRGQRLVGTFHSHPISEAIPGRGDLADAPGNSLMLIYDVCGVEAKLWRVIRRKRRVFAKILDVHIGRGI